MTATTTSSDVSPGNIEICRVETDRTIAPLVTRRILQRGLLSVQENHHHMQQQQQQELGQGQLVSQPSNGMGIHDPVCLIGAYGLQGDIQ